MGRDCKRGCILLTVGTTTHSVFHFVSLLVDKVLQRGRDIVQAEPDDFEPSVLVFASNVRQVWEHLSAWAAPACADLLQAWLGYASWPQSRADHRTDIATGCSCKVKENASWV